MQAQTCRVANPIIVLAGFALMEQPTYIALLLKRMSPPTSRAVVIAARISYISWFALKALSVAIAVRLFYVDWHLMPTWIKVNFVLTWIVASSVQGWSGMIQYGIYKHIKRSYHKAILQQQQALGKKPLLLYTDRDGDGSSEEGDQANMSPLLTPLGSDGSEDCIAAVEDEVHGADAAQYAKFSAKYVSAVGGSAAVTGAGLESVFAIRANNNRGRDSPEVELSPSSSGSEGGAAGAGAAERHMLLRSSHSSGSGKQDPLAGPQQQRGGKRSSSRSGSGSSGGGSGSSSARRQGAATLQRRTKSGILNMMECGISCQDE
jgi:uncharacterized membrane protein YgcG